MFIYPPHLPFPSFPLFLLLFFPRIPFTPIPPFLPSLLLLSPCYPLHEHSMQGSRVCRQPLLGLMFSLFDTIASLSYKRETKTCMEA